MSKPLIKPKVFFKTFGCRTNIYDTQMMIESLRDFEVTDNELVADIVVVNSCTVTNGADSGVRNYISKQNKDGKKIIFVGCGADTRGSELFAQKKVFGVLGHSEKGSINKALFSKEPFENIGVLTHIDESIVSNYHDKSKAFIKIQEGCNFSCSYCIIPYARGKARSQNEDKIIEQARILSQNGFSEFVLTGTNIGSYGKDNGTTLGRLLQKLGVIDGVKRVRIGSIEPVQIDDSFKEILKEGWLERHLHIALQHTNEEMLKIMRRRNSVKRDLELFLELSSLGFALGTDFIVGHPGESEDIWQDALLNFKKFPLTHLHAFCYSKRDGTLSALMKQTVDGKNAKKRLKELQTVVWENNLAFRQKKVDLEVLVEEKKDGFYTGFDQFYNRIFINSKDDLVKKWVKINDYEAKGDGNYAVF
ncbi:MAG: tRNA (N(6)-L-threonylcarbamoyladenosine(37)-C(2))-methylthiotransferase MtaB [Campylobacteraceae bacterium]|jgi:MiaB-like tRNA modifying enzyme|nr:tRNA (N(6)-L-threonylcarbamoyladenosine(37)-C(2))-methylthiotransferase MtaB [Campylobacteraceae bacterium]